MNATTVPTAGEIARRSAPALLLATALLVPFADKAFTTDDPVFMAEARHALTDPLHPTAFDMPWNGKPGRVSAMVPTGPVMAWLLVPAAASEHPEVVAHCIQLVLLWMAIVATVALASRLGVPPPWTAAAGLLVAAAPAVLAMAGTAMPDVAAMALGALALQQVVAWRQDGRPRQAVAAALLLGLAPLVRTQAVLLWGVALLILVRDPFDPRTWLDGPRSRWLILVVAATLTVGVMVLTRDPGAGAAPLASAAASFSSTRRVLPNLLAFLVHCSLALPLTLPWVLFRWNRGLVRPLVLAGATAIAAGLVRVAHPVLTPWYVAPLAGLSLTVLADILVDAWRRRDGEDLALGAWLLIALPAVIYVQLPAKLLVPSAPAAAVLVARALSSRPRLGRPMLAVIVLASASIGVAILRADAAFSELGRGAARTLIAPQAAQGRRVYYNGSWGFQWYAEQAGARFFPLEPPFPRPGDLVVGCRNCEPHIVPEAMEVLAPVSRSRHAEPGGRIMDKHLGAGFFSNHWGYLPWSWGSTVLDGYDVYVVRPY